MNTHDVLAYAVARELVSRVRASEAPWSDVLSAKSYITASRSWPIPDFVLVDETQRLAVGAEFKPPLQSKREYLTGLGQAIAYARDFDYGLLVVPTIADDGYPIAEHIATVLRQPAMSTVPVGLIAYDPSYLSPSSATFEPLHMFSRRLDKPAVRARLENSFYAKWREASPQEILALLDHSYEEMRHASDPAKSVRERAWDRVWLDIQAGNLHHWAGKPRKYKNTQKNKTAVWKNYRNFPVHVGWVDPGGALTTEGLRALHVGTIYGANSRPFLDEIAKAVLVPGKHLVLLSAITEFQDSRPSHDNEGDWLDDLEAFLELKGLLKRNEARSAAAVKKSERQFLKAEKQLWKELGLIVPRPPKGKFVFHPGRGFVINWSRITDLLQSPS